MKRSISAVLTTIVMLTGMGCEDDPESTVASSFYANLSAGDLPIRIETVLNSEHTFYEGTIYATRSDGEIVPESIEIPVDLVAETIAESGDENTIRLGETERMDYFFTGDIPESDSMNDEAILIGDNTMTSPTEIDHTHGSRGKLSCEGKCAVKFGLCAAAASGWGYLACYTKFLVCVVQCGSGGGSSTPSWCSPFDCRTKPCCPPLLCEDWPGVGTMTCYDPSV